MAESIWDLFAEDEEPLYQGDGTGAPPATRSGRQPSKPMPPPPRNATQLCGLSNLGATCYLNSLIQTLFFSPGFRQGLFKLGESCNGGSPLWNPRVACWG